MVRQGHQALKKQANSLLTRKHGVFHMSAFGLDPIQGIRRSNVMTDLAR